MYKLGINFDEISDSLDTALLIMRQEGINYGELRTVDKQNFVFWSDAQIKEFKETITVSGIELVAAATPLFKWYDSPDDPEVPHDSFGFDPRLDDDSKRRIIKRTFQVAHEIGIPRLRIFSGLGAASADATRQFAESPLLALVLEQADQYGIDAYLENEPVCHIHDQEQVLELFRQVRHPRLKFWLDIANLVEIGDPIDKIFMKEIGPRVGYVHVKDFIMKNGKKTYVPAGEGDVDFPGILDRIAGNCSGSLVVTVETHAKRSKIETSIKSIKGTRKLLRETGVLS